MMASTRVVGIDVGKDMLDISAFGEGATASPRTSIRRERDALLKVIDRCRSAGVELVVMEASGGYESLVRDTIHAGGIPVAIAQPSRVRDFARAIGRRAKTDAIDCQVIAQFGATVELTLWKPADPRLEEARELGRYRDELVQVRTADKLRLKQCAHECARIVIDDHIAFLDGKVAELDREIARLIAEVDDARTIAQKLRTVPGVGAVTAARLITELPELGKANRREIASLVGLAPMNDDSGHHAGPRHIMGGRREIRTALFQAANSAKIFNPVIRSFYAKLRAAGKHHLVAMVACARKLLVLLNAIVRSDRDWCPSYTSNRTPATEPNN